MKNWGDAKLAIFGLDFYPLTLVLDREQRKKRNQRKKGSPAAQVPEIYIKDFSSK